MNDDKKTDIVDVTPSHSDSNIVSSVEQSSSRSSQSNHSTHVQLLSLAKSFALDGSLAPADKQMPLQDRTQKRELLSLMRKQQNMEMIIEKSLGYCSTTEVADRTDIDWFANFVSLAENVSNKTMQDLWAKILAGEISHPGSFSVKSLQVFKQLSIYDAKLLAKACALAVKDPSLKHLRLITGCYQQPSLFNMFDKKREQSFNLSQFGLSYAELLTLADNHLLFIQETETHPFDLNEELGFKYNGIPFILSAKKAKCVLRFYKFTPIGAELAQLIADKPDKEYFAQLKNQLSYHFTA